MEAILHRLRVGGPWRDLPGELGPWQTAYARFNDWSRRGIWSALFYDIRGELDGEWNFIDGSYVKVHQHACGARHGERSDIGKSRGGNTTKIHASVDAHGNPVDFILTPGQVHDMKVAPELVDLFDAENVIGDKGYDSEALREKIRAKGSTPIIPRRKDSQKPNPEFDSHLYKQRHLVENLFARIKHFRAIATRFDKLSRNFKACVLLAFTWIWIKL